MGTRRGAGSVPVVSSMRGAASGEVTGQGSAGWLGERVPVQRVPGVRRKAAHIARSGEAEKNGTKPSACLGRLKGEYEKILAR
jgi:hypothetical protein